MTLTAQELEEVTKVHAIATEIVAEVGEGTAYHSLGYNYQFCKYVVDDEPACIVGRILVRLGWSIADFAPIEGQSVAYFYSNNQVGSYLDIETFNTYRDRLFTPTWYFLTVLQGAQDTQKPWGYALSYAVTTFADKYEVQL